jgi:hypothetical protein
MCSVRIADHPLGIQRSTENYSKPRGLSQADPSEDSAPKPIAKASLEGSVLHITVSDGFELIVTLKDETHAEILPAGAPP